MITKAIVVPFSTLSDSERSEWQQSKDRIGNQGKGDEQTFRLLAVGFYLIAYLTGWMVVGVNVG